MAMLLICPGEDLGDWRAALHAADRELDLRVWPETGAVDDIECAVTWNHPRGELRRYPNLRLVTSMGAGVDHILRDPELPPGVPITRLVDPSLVQSMTEYVVLAVLHHYRRFGLYRERQARREWRQDRRPRPADLHVGILGLGQLGTRVAEALRDLDLPVGGWARSRKSLAGIESWAGEAEYDAFLARTNVLVCLLPLTPRTRDILDARTFAGLERGAYLINVGRGAHLVEDDLIAALDSGQLSGACLDVFRDEPLPAAHPFWSHPGILVTPHISSLTDPDAVAPQIVENLRRARAGEPLENVVDPARGY